MGQYISGDYEATCKAKGKCKITVLYIPNKATKSVAATYNCNNDTCRNYNCAANNGTDDTCFNLEKIINAL